MFIGKGSSQDKVMRDKLGTYNNIFQELSTKLEPLMEASASIPDDTDDGNLVLCKRLILNLVDSGLISEHGKFNTFDRELRDMHRRKLLVNNDHVADTSRSDKFDTIVYDLQNVVDGTILPTTRSVALEIVLLKELVETDINKKHEAYINLTHLFARKPLTSQHSWIVNEFEHDFDTYADIHLPLYLLTDRMVNTSVNVAKGVSTRLITHIDRNYREFSNYDAYLLFAHDRITFTMTTLYLFSIAGYCDKFRASKHGDIFQKLSTTVHRSLVDLVRWKLSSF